MKIDQVLFKLISVCEINPKIHECIQSLYQREFITIEGSQKYYQDNFFNEFRNFMYPNQDEVDEGFHFYNRSFKNLELKHDRFDFSITQAEIMRTPNKLGVFSITVAIKETELDNITLLISRLRSFDLKVTLCTEKVEEAANESFIDDRLFSKVIEDEILGFNFRQNAISDLYSGSKFKVFFVGEYSELKEHQREHLLYDIATCSPVGSAAGNGFHAPHPDYYETIKPNFLRAFNNYEGLVLLDSFVVIGESIFTGPNDFVSSLKRMTWDLTYFRIYIYVLYLKYSLYRFNSLWKEGVSESFAEFEDFYYEYNISHISFNFLPQLIHDKIRIGIEIDKELSLFKERMQRLSEREEERQAQKQARLIQVASTAVVIASVPWSDLYDFFEKVKISPFLAFGVSFALLLVAGLAVFIYNKSKDTKRNHVSTVK